MADFTVRLAGIIEATSDNLAAALHKADTWAKRYREVYTVHCNDKLLAKATHKHTIMAMGAGKAEENCQRRWWGEIQRRWLSLRRLRTNKTAAQSAGPLFATSSVAREPNSSRRWPYACEGTPAVNQRCASSVSIACMCRIAMLLSFRSAGWGP